MQAVREGGEKKREKETIVLSFNRTTEQIPMSFEFDPGLAGDKNIETETSALAQRMSSRRLSTEQKQSGIYVCRMCVCVCACVFRFVFGSHARNPPPPLVPPSVRSSELHRQSTQGINEVWNNGNLIRFDGKDDLHSVEQPHKADRGHTVCVFVIAIPTDSVILFAIIASKIHWFVVLNAHAELICYSAFPFYRNGQAIAMDYCCNRSGYHVSLT